MLCLIGHHILHVVNIMGIGTGTRLLTRQKPVPVPVPIMVMSHCDASCVSHAFILASLLSPPLVHAK